jgi:hypothetical protein
MSNADIHNLSGGTGFQPVVSGVAPETVVGFTIAISRTNDLRRATHNEIRRDAGFDRRDARSTHNSHAPTHH